MEALTDLISTFKMHVDVYHNAKICGNWLYHETHMGKTSFHMVTKGDCQLNIPEHFETILNLGDMVIFPREIPHQMYPTSVQTGEQITLDFDQAEHLEGTGMLCGQACFHHQGSSHLLDALPQAFIVRQHEQNDWCRNLVDMIMAESVSPNVASQAIINRLSELIFIYALRQYLLENDQNIGLLALYSDIRIKKAISAIHSTPDYNWTLEKLANEAGMSRTAFTEKFRKISGWTPARYLAWWRMQLAWNKLSEGIASAEVAVQIGYKSEAAFSRAFQKHFGTTAGKIRRGDA